MTTISKTRTITSRTTLTEIYQKVFAIDPGTKESGFVIFNGEEIILSGFCENSELIDGYFIDERCKNSILAIEGIQNMGMAAGRDLFETCKWSGRMGQAWIDMDAGPVVTVYRSSVKAHLCGSAKAKDPNVRQALVDRYGEKGKKANPNPITYKISGHLWSALAIATYVMDGQKVEVW